jgi:AcrR family transcriptional regulator
MDGGGTDDGRSALTLDRPAASFVKLRPGPGRSREEVRIHQRERIHRALVDLIARHGYGGFAVRDVSALAGVSTKALYQCFDNLDGCLASAARAEMSRLLGQAAPERGPQAVVASLFESFAADPAAARLPLVDVFTSGEAGAAERRAADAEFEALLGRSLAAGAGRYPATRHLVAGMSAGVTWAAAKTARAERCGELPFLAGAVTDWMLSLARPELLQLRSLGWPTRSWNGERRIELAPRGQGPEPARLRLLRASLSCAAESGTAGLTEARVRADAGVSRQEFARHFANVEEPLFEASERLCGVAVERALSWALEVDDWAHRAYRLVSSLCAQVARDPDLARLLLVEMPARGERGGEFQATLIGGAAEALTRVDRRRDGERRLTFEASVAAALRIATINVAAGRAVQAPALAPLLTYVILAPAIGAGAAFDSVKAAR